MEYFSDAIEFNIIFFPKLFSKQMSQQKKNEDKRKKSFYSEGREKIAWFSYFGESENALLRGKEWEEQITIRKFLRRIDAFDLWCWR